MRPGGGVMAVPKETSVGLVDFDSPTAQTGRLRTHPEPGSLAALLLRKALEPGYHSAVAKTIEVCNCEQTPNWHSVFLDFHADERGPNPRHRGSLSGLDQDTWMVGRINRSSPVSLSCSIAWKMRYGTRYSIFTLVTLTRSIAN